MSEQEADHVTQPAPQTTGHHTALHRAAMVGNSDVVAALVKGGCALDLQDRDGNTALHEAAWHGFGQCVKVLVKAGADVHVRNRAGNIALHLACQNAHAQTARVLLLGGSMPDTKSNVGDTCLHVAARYDNLGIEKILLGALCSVSERNQAGDTALHVAAALNHKKTVQLLLEAGTDGNARNNAGKTAIDKARDNYHRDVALLLARAPQVHRFMRGRTVRKRRERLRAERRTQSVTGVEILPNKESGSMVEDTPSGEEVRSSSAVTKTGLLHHHHHHHHHSKATADASSPQSRRQRRRLRETALKEFHRRAENERSEPCRTVELFRDGDLPSPQNDRAYQLFTLYRDKDGTVRQAPANGCPCRPLIKRLERQLKATQEDMRLQILRVQEQVDCRLGKMDQKSRHQIRVLDMLSQERLASERRDMFHRIDQTAAQSREEAERRQEVDLCIPDNRYYKLLPSSSVDQSLPDMDLESIPLLSVVSGDSSSSLATYVNVLPNPSGDTLVGPDKQQRKSRKHLERKVDRSAEYRETTAPFPLGPDHSSRLLAGSADTCWQTQVVHDSAAAAIMGSYGEGCSSSDSSLQTASRNQEPEQNHSKNHAIHNKQITSHRCSERPADGTRTLEFFIDRPLQPTFTQERRNLHAVEVTQRFFETVSTQLERWYERKNAEAKRQVEERAQHDRQQLMQRIACLEEELQQLKTDGSGES